MRKIEQHFVGVRKKAESQLRYLRHIPTFSIIQTSFLVCQSLLTTYTTCLLQKVKSTHCILPRASILLSTGCIEACLCSICLSGCQVILKKVLESSCCYQRQEKQKEKKKDSQGRACVTCNDCTSHNLRKSHYVGSGPQRVKAKKTFQGT